MANTFKLDADHGYTLGRKAELIALSLDSDALAPNEHILNRLIDKVLSTQAELEQRNQELIENRKIIDAARKSYAQLYDKYANLFDFAPNGYLVIDHDGAITDANLTAVMMLNLPKAKLTGRRMTDFIHEDDQNTYQCLKDDCQKHAEVRICELTLIRADGRRFASQIQLQAFPERNSPQLEFRVALVDISEKTRISDSLALMNSAVEISGRAATAEQMLDEVIHQIEAYTGCEKVNIRLREANDTITIPAAAYTALNLEFCTAGYELSVRKDQCVCYAVMNGQTDMGKDHYTLNGSFFTNNASRFFSTIPLVRHCHTRTNDHDRYESMALIPISIAQHTLGLIHVADQRKNKVPRRVVDVLENVGLRIGLALQRFQTQTQLHKSNMELRALSSHILRVQEDEQHRIALELHDQIGQDLNVLKLRLKSIQKKLRKDQLRLKESCTQTLCYSDKIINDIRRIAHGLNPAALETLGLGGAVRQMVRELSCYSRLNIEARIAPLETVADRDIQIGLFRIIQEALNNIYKHAHATNIIIEATQTPQKAMVIVIHDDGIGLSSKPSHSARHFKGMGLAAMRLRARMIGAKLTIESKSGDGTRIKVSLAPIPKIKTAGAS